MHIGLLEAEILPEKVVAEFGGYGNMFERLLSPNYPNWSFHYYAVEHGQLPQSLDECDAYIITGSRHSAYDRDPWITELKDCIRQLDQQQRPCLGICFGHQVVAEALGGSVAKNEAGWGIGATTFDVVQIPPWMTETPEKFIVRVSHQDQVVTLPPNAQLFARNDFCPVGGYYLGNHLFCLQGHPEFENRYLERLIHKRRRVIGEEKCDKALISLEKYPNTPVAAGLISTFLESHDKR